MGFVLVLCPCPSLPIAFTGSLSWLMGATAPTLPPCCPHVLGLEPAVLSSSSSSSSLQGQMTPPSLPSLLGPFEVLHRHIWSQCVAWTCYALGKIKTIFCCFLGPVWGQGTIVGGCAQGWLCRALPFPSSFLMAPALLLIVFQRVLFSILWEGCSGCCGCSDPHPGQDGAGGPQSRAG